MSNILYFYIMKEDIFALFEKQQAAEPKKPEPERVPGEEPAKEEPAAEEVPQQEPEKEETQDKPENPEIGGSEDGV